MGEARRYGGRSAPQRRIDRRERLLAAGLELFSAKGYAGTSIEMICAQAGVSTRTFYEEFTGREDLLIALHEAITREVLRALDAALTATAGQPLPRRVDRAVRAYLDAVAGDPRRARVMHVEVVGVSRRVEAHRLAWRQRIADVLATAAAEAAAAAGAPGRDFHLGAIAVIGAVNELGYHASVHGPDVPLEAVAAELTRLATTAFTA